MALRWTMEAAWAAIAVLTSVAGGLYTTVYHSGASAAQILQLQQTQHVTDAHVAKHDDQLSTIQQQNAAMQQQLKDISDTVHDMHDNGVRTHGNH
jgi:hypothetical protein